MKKILLVLLICFCALPVFSQGIPERVVEIGIAETNFGFANNFLSGSEIFQKVMVINYDNLKDGFGILAGGGINPFYFNFNSRKNWGFGIFTGVDVVGSIDLNGKMLSLGTIKNAESQAAGALFAAAGGSAYFDIKGFKVRAGMGMFYPLIYTQPVISYTYGGGATGGLDLILDYNMRLYSAIDLDILSGVTDWKNFDMGSVNMQGAKLSANPGFDISAGVEFPLSKALGINDLLPFLDFDVGVDLYNIPLVPSMMKDYLSITGNIALEDFDLFDFLDPDNDFNFDDYMDMQDPKIVKDAKGKAVLRPFKLIAWADWRPINGSRLLRLRPFFGFAVNPLYGENAASMELGLKVTFDLFNIFILNMGLGYQDRLWKESLDIAINLRAIEIDLGIDMRSQNLAKSWQGGGVGVYAGIKVGW